MTRKVRDCGSMYTRSSKLQAIEDMIKSEMVNSNVNYHKLLTCLTAQFIQSCAI